MTIITFPLSESMPAHPHLRRFNLRRDLHMVADLIEQCFANLDADGRRYVSQMRNTARHPQFLRWAANLAERASVPFNGFVWEQDGQVVGNLSLIPMHSRGRRIFLIANVAVHPDYRRQGIARALTDAAVENCRAQRADETWLHVRDDNPGALRLYQQAGFVERARRAHWVSGHPAGARPPVKGVRTRRRLPADWRLQLQWLNEVHPEILDWYHGFNLNVLRPGLAGVVYRLLVGVSLEQWSVEWQERLVGTVAWVHSHSAADRLWLAAHAAGEEMALQELLLHVQSLAGRRTLNVEYPAGRGEVSLTSAGFKKRHTLVWMQYASGG
jgi:ribosomal protein S18 acetylase RimI-like enzyme